MKKGIFSILAKFSASVALALIMIGNFGVASAKVDFVADENLDLTGKSYVDDVMMAGSTMSGQFEVGGDLYAAGNIVEINGVFGDDVNLAGSQVELNGAVVDDVKLAGGYVTVNSQIGSDAMVAGGQVTIAKDAVIDGDLYLAGGMVRMFGQVKGDVYLNAGQAVVSGEVGGNLIVNAEDFSISDTAKIGGNLTYSTKDEIKDIDTANVGGEVVFRPLPELDMTGVDVAKVGGAIAGASIAARLSGFVVGLLMLFVFGLVMILLMPGFAGRTSKYFSSRMLISLLYGLLILIVMPIACVLAMITLIGLPVGIVGLVSYFILLYVAKVVASLSVGSAIIGRRKNTVSALVLSLALGLLITELITSIPLIGWFVNLILITVALGAMMYWFMNRHGDK